MAQPLIKQEMVLQRMVEHMQKEQAYVTRKGKKLIPQCIDDLPPRLRRHTIGGKLNPLRQKAYNQLRYELIDKPRRAEKGRFIHNENTEGQYRTWAVNELKVLSDTINELGYTRGLKKAATVLSRTLKSCSMAYKRYKLNNNDEATIVSKDLGITSHTDDYRKDRMEFDNNGNVIAEKRIARTGRVNEDTFVNIVNEYRQVLNLVKSTLTPEGAIEMYWEAKS